jgi:hypothetical protein
MNQKQVNILAGIAVFIVIVLIILGIIAAFPKQVAQFVYGVPTLMRTATSAPTPTPTTIPDFSGAFLVYEDLPPGFEAVHPSELGLEHMIPNRYTQVKSAFGFTSAGAYENVFGFTIVIPPDFDPQAFDPRQKDPARLLDAVARSFPQERLRERRDLPELNYLGDLSYGGTLVIDQGIIETRVDLVAFRHGSVLAVAGVKYANGAVPPVTIDDAARKLDNRIIDVIQFGTPTYDAPTPVPSPVPISNISPAALTQADFPPDFEAIPEDKRPFTLPDNGGTTTDIRQHFAFQKIPTDQSEVVLGFSVVFTHIYDRELAGAVLQSPEKLLLQARRSLEFTVPVEWQPLPGADGFGEQSAGWSIAGETTYGPQYAEMILFRKGPTLTGIMAIKRGDPTLTTPTADLARILVDRVLAIFPP